MLTCCSAVRAEAVADAAPAASHAVMMAIAFIAFLLRSPVCATLALQPGKEENEGMRSARHRTFVPGGEKKMR